MPINVCHLKRELVRSAALGLVSVGAGLLAGAPRKATFATAAALAGANLILDVGAIVGTGERIPLVEHVGKPGALAVVGVALPVAMGVPWGSALAVGGATGVAFAAAEGVLTWHAMKTSTKMT